MTTTLVALLEAALTLLALVQANPNLPPAVREQALAVAQSVIAEASRSMAAAPAVSAPPAVASATSGADADADVDKVRATQFFLPNKEWVHPDVPASDGTTLTVLEEYMSFGYLNSQDIYNDAVVVVGVTKPNTTPKYYLATLMNNSGLLAHTDLDDLPQFTAVHAHRIAPGSFTIELAEQGNATRRVFTYLYATGTLSLAR